MGRTATVALNFLSAGVICEENKMYSDSSKFLKLLLVLLVFSVCAFRLEAQSLKLFERTRPTLGEKLGPTPKSRPSVPEMMIPLEGKIDRLSYRLGPGDEVDVSIWGMELYESYHLFVSAEGRLLVPPAGPLEVDGMPLAEAEAYLAQRMSEYFSEARISLTLINPRTFRVFAVGALARPGTYFMSAVDRVSELLTEAGGVRSGGSRRRIRLLDGDRRLLTTVDMMRYLMQGNLQQNPMLIDGCIVEVPPMENYVVLRGSFTNLSGSDSVAVGERQIDQISEFVIEYLPGETLGDLLELVGGPENFETAGDGRLVISDNPQASQRWVPLTREMIESPPEQEAIYEFPVRNKWVFVSGSVNLPGRYIYQPGWTVRDYLGQAGGPNIEGSGKKCYIRRSDGSNDKSKPGDLVLPGDVLYVPHRFKFYEWSPLVTLLTAMIFLLSN